MSDARSALDRFRGMAVFAKTVEAGSFRAAAQALGLSPSVVSHHIAQLEASLGVTLLHRTTRRLALTREGRDLYAAARDMVAAAERGLDQVLDAAGSPAGHLTVAAPAAIVHEPLFDALAAFAAAFPAVSMAFHLADAQVDLIEGGIDLALRAGNLRSSDLKSKKVGTLYRKLVASPALASRHPLPRHPTALASWSWIQLRARPPVAVFAQKGVEIAFTARLTVDTAAAALALARSGLGLAMVPAGMAEADLREGRLVEVLPDWPIEAPSIYAVWPASARRQSLARQLVSFLEKRAAT